jgi:integrase
MLTSAIGRYLDLRRALGYKLDSAEYILRGFARLAESRSETHVTIRTAVEWASHTRTARQRAKRIGVLIGFARFLHAEDPQHEVPPPELGPKAPRPLPYIFSRDELRRLATAATDLGPPESMRALTFSTLFNLLAVTGLRISEALSLRLEDFTPDGLFIRETKFHKSRLVPLHETTSAALNRYLQRRLKVPVKHDRLFVSSRYTQPLCYEHVRCTFRQLCLRAGILGPAAGPRPRLHDIRHTAAVRALEACPGSRKQVTPHMLALSTYLGHSSVRATYWYLHTSPQLMADIAAAGESWLRGDAP